MSVDRSTGATALPGSTRRWSGLGLRWNPFRVLQSDELIGHVLVPIEQRLGVTVDTLLVLADPLVQITAPQGVGKTTVLQAVAAHVSAQSLSVRYHYLTAERCDSLPPFDCDVLLLDEIQRLRRAERRRLTEWLRRGSGRAVCATHRVWRPRGLRTRQFTVRPATAATVQEFFRRRIAYAGGDDAIRLSEDAAEWLVGKLRTLRAAEWLLYEVFQAEVETGDCRNRQGGVLIGVDDMMPFLKTLRQYRVPVIRQSWLRLKGLFSKPSRLPL